MDDKVILALLYDTCFNCMTNIELLNERTAATWSEYTSKRYFIIYQSILKALANNDSEEVRILNASGIGVGHQDFSLREAISRRFDKKITWDT